MTAQYGRIDLRIRARNGKRGDGPVIAAILSRSDRRLAALDLQEGGIQKGESAGAHHAASSSVAPALAGMKLMARSASAVMVRLGFTPRLAESIDPSTTYRPW